MKIQGEHNLNAPREQVWRLLLDPEVLKRCTPGCERLEQIEENTYEAVLNLGVAAVKGRYTGQVRLEEIQPPSHLKMIIEGKGAQGFVKGTGYLDVREVDGGTNVTYNGDVQLGGPIASIAQRMLQSSAKMMAGQFFTAIEAEVAAVQQAEAAGQPVIPPKQGLFRNLFRYLWVLLKRVFARKGA
ncbi:MAG: carbon monoxide dehydrogenase subunit G [Acidobacteria bacterium]|nr:carbon monoxide dehydrogenase subunit G [Acidobacteriota bacterium]